MKDYTKLYHLKKELNNLENVKDTLIKTDIFSHDQIEKVNRKIEENRTSIEKIEKSFRGKGFYENIVNEITYSYCQDEKFRNEIQGVNTQEKYKMFIFNEFMEAFEDEIFVQRLFTLTLVNKMIARPSILQTSVLSAEKMASNISTFFKDMENGGDFFKEIMHHLVQSNKTFFPLVARVSPNFKELIIQN